MKQNRARPRKMVAGLAALLILAAPALAGPPLLCQSIEIGAAQSLPWSSSGWNITGQEKYDAARLVPDTLALLAPETPVLVRMETLRRATLYVQHKPAIAKELLTKLEARTYDKPQEALAAFDFGYLAECYKQMSWLFQYADDLKATPQDRVGFDAAKNVDGYGLVSKAIQLTGQNPEMEFAAALIVMDKHEQAKVHLQIAQSGAKDNATLARNLEKRFPNKVAQSH